MSMNMDILFMIVEMWLVRFGLFCFILEYFPSNKTPFHAFLCQARAFLASIFLEVLKKCSNL